MQAFIERGVKAVKMDDIATKLTISKRTLYEIYTDKEQLLFEGIKKYDESKRLKLQQYAAQGHSVIDIILEAYRMKIKEIRMVNPTFYIDIMKYPRVEQFIRENNERMRHHCSCQRVPHPLCRRQPHPQERRWRNSPC